jgi:arylsulfatase A-like enzyme
MKMIFHLCTLVSVCLCALSAPAPAAADAKPNIIIIYADDLGYGDLGCYGHPTIRTPNLDRMAAEGMRFTDFYSAGEVCTPSRAALLTGRYAVRSGMAGGQRRVMYPNSKGGLPETEITIATGLKAVGYATSMVGKWHLGNHGEFLPTRHGFDSWFGLPYSNDMVRAPNSPKGREAVVHPKSEYFRQPLLRGVEEIERGPDQSQLTKRYTAEAVKFIREHKAEPFFFYFAHTFPHVPLFASSDFAGKSRRGLYGDVVEELDWSVGQVFETLRAEGLAENTFVFFSSDNGPWLSFGEQGGSAGLLREGKGSTWEGGMREPGIAWWPGRIKAGSVNTSLASTMDLFVTCLKLGGAEIPQDRVIDGFDLSPTLFDSKPGMRDTFFYYRGEELFAVRKGIWKMHFRTQNGYGQPKPDVHDPPLLFNLGIDPGESFDVAAQHPEVIEELRTAVEKHRATITPVKSQVDEEPAPAAK